MFIVNGRFNMDSKPDSNGDRKLTNSEKAEIERKRQKALLLRQSRRSNHPYLNNDNLVVRIGGSKVKDSGAGFFIDEDESQIGDKLPKIIREEAAPFAEDIPKCNNCHKEFDKSLLFSKFDVKICDNCKDDEAYSLISKTEAKNEFLLKECDFDKREPALKFIVRKNPHNERWGDMKLFLRSDVEKRALEIWGSEENMECEREKRSVNSDKLKRRKNEKKMKVLRMAMRSSLYKKQTEMHEHGYGSETYDSDSDMYSKTCQECGHEMTYEKM